MTHITRLFLATLVIGICATASLSQATIPAVEVKDDEFSGKRKVKLNEQQIAPELKMILTCTVNTARPRREYDADLDYAEVTFISTTGKREYGDRDAEFNFLVDGSRVRGGPVNSSPLTDKIAEDGKEIAIGVVYLSALEKIARGREVKMKIGDKVFQLDKTVIKNLQAYVKALGR